jgi:peptide/nickel transport system permease protein
MSTRTRIGLGIVSALAMFALFGPLLGQHDAFVSRFDIGRDAFSNPVAPNASFWLGTDLIFRDQFTRLALGARISLFIGISATLIATVLGAVAGILSGYYEARPGVKIAWLVGPLAVLFLVNGSPLLLLSAALVLVLSSSRFAACLSSAACCFSAAT